MSIDKAHSSTTQIHHHHALGKGCASVVARVMVSMLIFTCFLGTLLSSPYHPKATVKNKKQPHHTKVRRDEVRYGAPEITLIRNATAGSFSNTKSLFDPIDLHLPKFPTLQKELKESEIVVLYFGAQWNPQSQAVTAMMDQVLQPKLLQAPQQNGKHSISVVYVSSDRSKNQFRNMNRNRFWAKVPWENGERKRLKHYFKVCAKTEMEKLKLQRKHEIPHVLVLSGKTHKVVSRKGVEDLQRWGPAVVDYWTKLTRGNVGIIPK